MKISIDQNLRKARTLIDKGQAAEAEILYWEILKEFPKNNRAINGLRQLITTGAISDPSHEISYLINIYNEGKLNEVIEYADVVTQIYPESVVIYNISGVANAALLRFDEALASYDKAIQLRPDFAVAHYNRGNALSDLKRHDEALASFDKAIQIKPDYAEAHYNRGNALSDLKRPDEAVASYDKAIRIKPDHAEAHNNRGNALRALKRLDEAVASFDKAIQIKPDYAEACYNQGNALNDLKRHDEALASYDKAILIRPDHAETHNNRGNALRALRRLDEALASYDRAIQIKPDHALALGLAIHQRAHICDWTARQYALDPSVPGAEGDAASPFTMLAHEDNPAAHFERAKAWADQEYAHVHTSILRYFSTHEKLRVGYFSAQFHNHATMYLMAGLFELHDKSKFEIHAFSYGGESQDEMRQRLIGAVHEFHDVSGLSDSAVADLARSKAIDIAVDLTGYTRESRPGIFAYRAAPIQINYLGYPGSMGADFIDYIVADKMVIPDVNQKYYSEKVIYLPNTYQITDDSREISRDQFSRAEFGLPNDGFVFCCFNNNYKITPVEFDIWMRLLAKVDDSVLWLLKDNAWAQANLRKEAEARGVDPARLVFAERMPMPDHLARHRYADLFLDTFNYNAHTTASDALWAGLPVLTKLGQGFAARVAGSLLHAIGLPELVTDTPAAYEQLALDLATNPDRLASIKAKLAANRLTTPLFNTAQFTRDIERAYQMAHERHAKGLPPDHLQTPNVRPETVAAEPNTPSADLRRSGRG